MSSVQVASGGYYLHPPKLKSGRHQVKAMTREMQDEHITTAALLCGVLPSLCLINERKRWGGKKKNKEQIIDEFSPSCARGERSRDSTSAEATEGFLWRRKDANLLLFSDTGEASDG